MNSSRPDILFILTDQQQKRSLSPYRDPLAHTPVLDRLAREGTTFDTAYTTCPICSPARASLQTGLYPFRHGMQTNIFQHGCMQHELTDSPHLLSRRLRDAGYEALLTGKWHLGYGRAAREDAYFKKHYGDIDLHLHDVELPTEYLHASGLASDVGYTADDFPGHGGGGQMYPQFRTYLRARGLAYFAEPRGRLCAEVLSPPESTVDHFLAERAIALIDGAIARRSDAPFFCMLNFWGPHEPAHVPTSFLDPWRQVPIAPWNSFQSDQSAKPRIHKVTRAGWSWECFEQQLRFAFAYSHFIDSRIGLVIDHLQRIGRLDNTWIIYSADHGDSLGIHGGLVNKAFHFYEQAVSIPLVVRPPRGTEARHSSLPVNLTDLYTTILDIATGRSDRPHGFGRSLRPVVEGEPVDDMPDHVVTECSGLGHCLTSQRMFRQGAWKYVFNVGDIDELYNLEEDPDELNNRILDSAVARQMREGLLAWMERYGDGLQVALANLCH